MSAAAEPRDPILVVDDDPGIRRLVCCSLATLGHEVFDAADGTAAEEILATRQPCLVIADLRMPGQSGLDLLQAMRRRGCPTPVVMISGDTDVEMAVACLRAGAADFLTKPFTLRQLRDTVARVLASSPLAAGLQATVAVTPGQTMIDGYRIVRTLGCGSNGIVYLTERNDDHGGGARPYAVKVFRDLVYHDAAERSEALRRFCREAELLSRVQHPCVRAVVGYGVHGDAQTPYLAMEYLDGKPLRELIGQASLSVCDKVFLLRQVAEALQAVHRAGICHRDVKPSNIFVLPDLRAKLTDFGIARTLNSELTVANSFLGTPAYAAPEAFLTAQVDHRADLFSLGVVAYELLLGRLPFAGDTFSAVGHQIETAKPLCPRRLDPDFPPALQDILARLLRKRPDERYPSAAVAADHLGAFLTAGRAKLMARLWQGVASRLADSDWS